MTWAWVLIFVCWYDCKSLSKAWYDFMVGKARLMAWKWSNCKKWSFLDHEETLDFMDQIWMYMYITLSLGWRNVKVYIGQLFDQKVSIWPKSQLLKKCIFLFLCNGTMYSLKNEWKLKCLDEIKHDCMWIKTWPLTKKQQLDFMNETNALIHWIIRIMITHEPNDQRYMDKIKT